MKILVPLDITADMLQPGTSLAEDPSPAWAPSTAYALGAEVYRLSTHRVYRATKAIANTVTTPPESDPTAWKDMRPTNRMAPFDTYTSTQAKGTGSIKYVLTPGFYNTIRLDGLVGAHVQIKAYESQGGGLAAPILELDLFEPVGGWYEWLFSPFTQLKTAMLTGIITSPDSYVEITITAPNDGPVAVGMISFGDLRPLVPEEYWGDSEHGSSAEPVTYSYVDVDEDGTLVIVRRNAATNLRIRVQMDRRAADTALQAVQEVLDIPCLWIASDDPGYQGLSTFGLGSGSLSYDSYGNAIFNINVKGTI